MTITGIKIKQITDDGKLKAAVSVTLDNSLAVHDIKVIQGNERLFVAMPSRRSSDGRFLDIVHPISSELRRLIEEEVLRAYFELLKNAAAGNGSSEGAAANAEGKSDWDKE